MTVTGKNRLRVAILDLYEGVENQGMRCLREILNQFAEYYSLDLVTDEFEVRLHKQVPGLDYDCYISSGGPGSPLESEGSDWEAVYFDWYHQVAHFNLQEENVIKKKIFFICHSFQLVCRHLEMATVSKRKSTAFGVFPIHLLPGAHDEAIFRGLLNPFYAVDSREYQVTGPDHHKLKATGASIIAIEKARPHVPLERAIMAIRFNENMVGTQFHPEADAIGMSLYLQTPAKKEMVIENHGKEKWQSMIDQLNDKGKIMHTYEHVLPNFLLETVNHLMPLEV